MTAGVVSAIFGIAAAIASGLVVGFPPEWQSTLVEAVVYIAGVVVVAQSLYLQFKPLIDKLTTATSPAPVPAPEHADTGTVTVYAGVEDGLGTPATN